MIEMQVKPEWEGKSLLELNLRKRYAVNIVAIVHGEEIRVNIDPELPLERSMKLIVIANTEKLNKIR
jgi:trk system potassium uptake protein TrkA